MDWAARREAMGRNKNLTLYFTEEGTGARYWFSMFHGEAYRPRDGQIAFDKEDTGTRYKMTTRRNDKAILFSWAQRA
jgi:hypothetical protein